MISLNFFWRLNSQRLVGEMNLLRLLIGLFCLASVSLPAADTVVSRRSYFLVNGNKVTIVPVGMVFVEAGSSGQSAFCIGEHEVTNEEYALFIDSTGREQTPPRWTRSGFPEGRENHPVAGVSRADAIAYAAWLSNATGWDLTLPTSTQFKRASIGARSRDEPVMKRFSTRPVGSDPMDRSVYGCYDLVGGVAEWMLTPSVDDGRKVLRGFRLVLNSAGLDDRNEGLDSFYSSVGEPVVPPEPVQPAPFVPVITQQPVSVNALRGANVSFTVVALANSEVSYQWYLNEAALPGATASILQLSNVQLAAAGAYRVVVTNKVTRVGDRDTDITVLTYTTTSETATLSVVNGIAPVVVKQPSAQTLAAGGSLSLSVTASGSQPFTFKWKALMKTTGQSSPSNTTSVVVAETADSSTITLSNVSSADSADYSVVVSNAFGSVTSDNATVLVIDGAKVPTITTQPSNVAVATGGTAVLRVEASGTPSPVYQWSLNGAPVSGATGSSFTIANAQAIHAGNYTVSASNVLGSVTSNAATLSINSATLPVPSNPSSGGGGGGAPSHWFLALIALSFLARVARRKP